MFFACHEEDRLQMGAHAPVEQRHLKLDFIVGDGPDATQNHAGLAMRGIVDKQSFEGIHLHVGKRNGRLLQHFDSFGDRKEGLFLRVFENRYDELTDQAGAARDQIQVSVGQRIERAWIDGDKRRGHGGKF